MKKKTKKGEKNLLFPYLSSPIVYAYLIFLFISIIVYVICRVFKNDYFEWNKIVVAATVATCFFTFANVFRIAADLHSEKVELSSEYREQLKLIGRTIAKDFHTDDDSLSNGINELNAEIEEEEILKLKNEKRYYVLMILGFLAFFSITCFNIVYETISDMQSYLTMLAFMLMLVCEEIIIIRKRILKEEGRRHALPLELVITMLDDLGVFNQKRKGENTDGQVEDGE